MALTLRTARCMAVLTALAALAAFSAARANHFILPCGDVCSEVVTEFSTGITANAGLGGITAGPDGNLWFTEGNIDRIGRITPDGAVTEFSAGITAGAYPTAIAAGPDGNLWFTEPGTPHTVYVGPYVNRIGRITPQGVVTEFSDGIPVDAFLGEITAGPDGNLWFTETGLGRIARITPLGVVTEFPVPLTRNHHVGAAITAGPDGNLWFTVTTCLLCAASPPWIGRITPLGVITRFDVVFFPGDITFGPDGNLWISTFIPRIARMTPAGVLTQFSVSNSVPSITAGPDGNLWFTERPFSSLSNDASWIGRITPAGVVTEFSGGLSANAHPSGITAGPDGNLWFTEPGVNRIGRITAPAPATATTIDSSVNPSLVGQAVIFTASVGGNFPTGTAQFKDNGSNLGSPVTLSGGGIAQLVTSTLTQGVHPITAAYSGDRNNAASESAPLAQVVNVGGGSINVALASNGGVASASSSSPGYPVSSVNDGDRAGMNFGAGGVWKDATRAGFPDWVQIDFNAPQTIDHVIVYSVQDNTTSPVQPSDSLTFSIWGVTDFDVQVWNAAAWVTVGAVSKNNLVKRAVYFVPTTTSKIRVVINATPNGRYSMLTEIEAWTH